MGANQRRLFWVLVAAFYATMARTQTTLGTKPDLALPSDSGYGGPVGFAPLVQLFVAVVIVAGMLKFMLPKLLPKLNRKLTPSLSSRIKIEESASFAGGTLYVVKVDQRQLLLSAGTHGVNCLCDLGKASRESEAPAFFELVDQAQKKIATPTHAAIRPPAETKAKAEEALSRLERLLK